jgi:hypothetical protein
MPNTAEIIKILSIMCDKPFRREDIEAAKKRERGYRKDLVDVSLPDYEDAIGKQLITDGNIHGYGLRLLKEYEILKEFCKTSKLDLEQKTWIGQPGDVSTTGETTTYVVGVEPPLFKTKEIRDRIEAEVAKERMGWFADTLRKSDWIKKYEIKDGCITIDTETPFYRTSEDVNNIRSLAAAMGTTLKISGSEAERAYTLFDGVSLVSEKGTKKGFGACKNLKIRIASDALGQGEGVVRKMMRNKWEQARKLAEDRAEDMAASED